MELKLVLDGLEFLDYGLIELSESKFGNPQLHKIGVLERSRAIEVHHTIEMIKDADVILIPLDLTEEWCDTVLGVSPVPLQRPCSKTDIIVANSYTKSVLRSAAQKVSSNCNWVDYYPSFKMVMYSPRAES